MKLANIKIVKEITKHGGEVARYLSKNSPTILTGCAVAGAFVAVGLAIRATKPALEHIREEKIEHRDRLIIKDGDKREDPNLTDEEIDQIQLKPTEIAKAVWKDYVPTGIALAGTTACIIGAHSISAKRTAAMAALYTMSENALKEYKEQAEKMVGKKKAGDITDAVNAEKVAKNSPPPDGQIANVGGGSALCYEPITGRYFWSTAEKIQSIVNDLNARMIGGDERIPLNELFYELGLDGVKYGDDMGWSVENMIKPRYTSSLTSDCRPVLVLDHENAPYAWYRDC